MTPAAAILVWREQMSGSAVAYHRADWDGGFYLITPIVGSSEGGVASFTRVREGQVEHAVGGIHLYPTRTLAMVAATCHAQYGSWA